MDRISAWIDGKPCRFQLILLGHTAAFTCAILIAAGLFRTPAPAPTATHAERTLVGAHGLAERPTSRTTETASTDRNGARSVTWTAPGRVFPALGGTPPSPRRG